MGLFNFLVKLVLLIFSFFHLKFLDFMLQKPKIISHFFLSLIPFLLLNLFHSFLSKQTAIAIHKSFFVFIVFHISQKQLSSTPFLSPLTYFLFFFFSIPRSSLSSFMSLFLCNSRVSLNLSFLIYFILYFSFE